MANTDNLKKGKRISEEVAREYQAKSAAARKRNNAERKLIKDRILERMSEDDWDEMIDGLISRAKDDTKSYESLRDTIGEKPKEQISVDTPTKFVITRKNGDDL